MARPLPAPIATYFAATSPAEFADCFTDDAQVTDERRTHRGRDEILHWREEVAKISFQQAILATRGEGDTFVVTCRVSGDFPGSPVELNNTFTLAGDKIAALSID